MVQRLLFVLDTPGPLLQVREVLEQQGEAAQLLELLLPT
jgi:hypothetical protein